MSNLIELVDDGLQMSRAHDYAVDKYRLLGHYAQMFSTGMKFKWDHRIYIDLFSGAGYARIEETNKIVAASPIIALEVSTKFNKYIFCESDPELAETLEQRVARDYSNCDVTVIVGDANQAVGDILNLIPQSNRSDKVLSLCFVDPYNFKDISFKTIRTLADNRRLDFIVLIPSYMDAHRNPDHYTKPGDRRIETYLGNPNWRESWAEFSITNNKFGAFFSSEFRKQMKNLGYINPGAERTVIVRRTDNNSPLYDLAFFSKHVTGLSFWEKTMKGVFDQQTLFE